MSAIVFNDGFLQVIAGLYLNGSGSAISATYRLYTNNYSPTPGDTVSSYTESTAPGYTAQNYSSGSWSIANVSSGVNRATNSPATYTYTAGETVYGYFVTDPSNTTLYWSQLFDTPITIPSIGGVITFTPSIDQDTPI